MNILVSGGGIAGLAAANFLNRGGHAVTVIDKAPAFRNLGYALTIKNFGLKILAELGLREELDRHALPHRQLYFYDSSGKLLKTYSEEVAQTATKGSVLALRSELHGVLYRAVKDLVPIQLGLHPEKVDQENGAGGRVRVSLSNGEDREFDLLVSAEGLRSSTRKLLFEDTPGQGMRPFGVMYAASQVAGEHGLDPMGVHMYFGSGRTIYLVPMTHSELVLLAFFRDEASPDEPPHFTADKLLEAFRSFSPKVLEQIEAVSANGYAFFDSVAMIELPELSRGRVVFMGDAGYCPTFLSGMGASLGLLGAKALAEALAGVNDVTLALARYGSVMMPVVRHFQQSAHANVKGLLTANDFMTAIRDSLIHLAPPSLAAMRWSKQYDVEEKLLAGIV